jgi:hypothetical protein
MAHLDASSAECIVSTFKEGVLSALAHDLRIRVERFEVEVDDATLAVKASFDASSLRVVGAVRAGAVDPSALSDADRAKIERSIADDVLHPRDHALISFVSSSVEKVGDGVRVDGALTLHGTTKHVSTDARAVGDELVAELRVHQPDFGVRPFSAMLGTLKIKPDVVVRFSVPRAALPPVC